MKKEVSKFIQKAGYKKSENFNFHFSCILH